MYISEFFLFNFISLNLGFILDLVFGDPNYSWHPIILLGKLNKKLEKLLYFKEKLKVKGTVLVIVSIIITLIISGAILVGSYLISPLLYLAISIIMSYQIFATRSLYNASNEVFKELAKNDLKAARIAVGMIVGRSTDTLKREEVINACIESVVENTSDGITAPMMFMAIGGPALGMVYKDINTLDSMIGYKNKRYQNFGFFAAKLDDFVNLIPARLTAWLMIVASFILRYNYKESFKVYMRDKNNHLSPNAGHLEAATAGALDIQLGGTHTYFNEVVEKPTIGNKIKKSNKFDIVKANKLMVISSVLSLIIYDIIYLLFLF